MYKIINPKSRLAGFQGSSTCSTGAKLIFIGVMIIFLIGLLIGLIASGIKGNFSNLFVTIAVFVGSIGVVCLLGSLDRLNWLDPILRAILWVFVSNKLMSRVWRVVGSVFKVLFANRYTGASFTHSFAPALILTAMFIYAIRSELMKTGFLSNIIPVLLMFMLFWMTCGIIISALLGLSQLFGGFLARLGMNWEPITTRLSFLSDWYHRRCKKLIVVPDGATFAYGLRVMFTPGQGEGSRLLKMNYLDVALVSGCRVTEKAISAGELLYSEVYVRDHAIAMALARDDRFKVISDDWFTSAKPRNNGTHYMLIGPGIGSRDELQEMVAAAAAAV